MSPTLSINIGGEEREIKMSFGLLNACGRAIGDPTRCTILGVDENLRNAVLAEVLAERKPSGKIIKPIEDIDDIDISVDDVVAILEWVTEHVLDFFVRSVQKSSGVLEKHMETLKALKSSAPGSLDSASPTASAGPSA